MGGWQLEVGKMALYMAFPVGMFHWFNNPEYFEKWVIFGKNFRCFATILNILFDQVTETKRQLYPPESMSHRSEIEVRTNSGIQACSNFLPTQ